MMNNATYYLVLIASLIFFYAAEVKAQKPTDQMVRFELSEAVDTFKQVGKSTLEKYMKVIFTGSNIYKNKNTVNSFLDGAYDEFESLVDSLYSSHSQKDIITLRITIYKNNKIVKTFNWGNDDQHNFKFSHKSRLLLSTSGGKYVISATNYRQEWVVIPPQQKLGLYIQALEKSREFDFMVKREIVIIPDEIRTVLIKD